MIAVTIHRTFCRLYLTAAKLIQILYVIFNLDHLPEFSLDFMTFHLMSVLRESLFKMVLNSRVYFM